MIKNPPAMQEMLLRPLGQEDPLEKEMATHSSILAWRIPWIEEPGGLQWDPKRVRQLNSDNNNVCNYLLLVLSGEP